MKFRSKARSPMARSLSLYMIRFASILNPSALKEEGRYESPVIPGEIFYHDEPITANAGRPTPRYR